MQDSAKDKSLADFSVNERELYIDRKPAVLTDAKEYELDLLRYRNENESGDVVEDVLARTEGLIDEYSKIALSALAKLGAFPDGSFPDSHIELDLPEAPHLGELSVAKPGKPDYEMPQVGDMPGMRGDIQAIVMQNITAPDTTLPVSPTATLDWDESPYISELFSRLRDTVTQVIMEGGSGLADEFEQGLWDRAVAREELQHEQRYNEAERYFAAKGHVAPPGGLISRLNMLNRERLRNLELMNSEIVVKQLELGRQHMHFMSELGVKLETLSIEERNGALNRALDAAKSSISMLYENYKVQLEGIRQKTEIYKIQVESEEVRVNALSSANKSVTETYTAEIDAYIRRLTAEFSVIEHVIKMYVAELGGYEAEVRAGAAKVSATVERYKAQVSGAEVQAQIELGEYEQLVKAILGEIQLKLSSQQEAGRLAAQVAASALSAFNASASISDSSSRSRNYGENKSVSTSNSFTRSISNSLGVSTSQSEGATDSYSESRNFNYSGTE